MRLPAKGSHRWKHPRALEHDRVWTPVQLSPEALRRAEHLPGPQNNVRVVSETIDRISAQRAFETNVRVAQAQNRLSQTLLDMTA